MTKEGTKTEIQRDLSSGNLDPNVATNPLKFGASATVGFPIAVAASAFSLIFLAIAKSIQLATLHIGKMGNQVQNPMGSMLYDTLLGGLKKLWTEFGVYAEIKAGQTLKSGLNNWVKSLDPEMQKYFEDERARVKQEMKDGKITDQDIDQRIRTGVSGGAEAVWKDSVLDKVKGDDVKTYDQFMQQGGLVQGAHGVVNDLAKIPDENQQMQRFDNAAQKINSVSTSDGSPQHQQTSGSVSNASGDRHPKGKGKGKNYSSKL